MPNVLPFIRDRQEPPARRTALSIPATHGARGEYAVGDLARVLKLAHFDVRTIIAKLRLLAATRAMPLPRTPRLVRGAEIHGPAAIYRRSRWDAGEIDAWMDDRGPNAPASMPVAGSRVPPPIRMEMAQRARAAAGAA